MYALRYSAKDLSTMLLPFHCTCHINSVMVAVVMLDKMLVIQMLENENSISIPLIPSVSSTI
jgi:hypothetical protein